MLFKAVIFDMDGTLINSLADIADCANRVLAANNYPQHELASYQLFVGEGAYRLIEQILPDSEKSETNIQHCLADFLREYEKFWDVKTRLYTGIAEMLDALSRLNVKLTILSNKPDRFTKQFADKYLGRWNFLEVLGASEFIPHKPNPKGALLIIEDLGFSADECLFVGDSKLDMQTATNTGMKSVGVLWGFRSKEELLENGAHWLIQRPEQLVDFFN